jgi:hypothetical protein
LIWQKLLTHIIDCLDQIFIDVVTPYLI